MLSEQQYQRYSRQMRLPQLDAAAQQRLLAARALIVGLGGLGSPVSLYLAAAGIGTLVVTDFDRVELSNLHRQVMHGVSDIGRPKVEAASTAIAALNPDVHVEAINGHLQNDALLAQVAAADVVLDCSDNLATRFEVNAACLQSGTPLVSGAAVRYEGQLSVFLPNRPDSPCYRCLYPADSVPDDSCSLVGILGPVVGVIGSAQALEAIKVLLELGEPLCGRIAYFDGIDFDWRIITLPRNPACPACAGRSASPASTHADSLR